MKLLEIAGVRGCNTKRAIQYLRESNLVVSLQFT